MYKDSSKSLVKGQSSNCSFLCIRPINSIFVLNSICPVKSQLVLDNGVKYSFAMDIWLNFPRHSKGFFICMYFLKRCNGWGIYFIIICRVSAIKSYAPFWRNCLFFKNLKWHTIYSACLHQNFVPQKKKKRYF